MSEIGFARIDAERVMDEAMAALEAKIGEYLAPADERRLFFAHVLAAIVGIYGDLDRTGRSNLLRYAAGEVLDAIGQRSDTHRLPGAPAQTRLKFTLSAARGQPILIPQGTRVTPDGQVYFATSTHLSIPAGDLAGEVEAQSVLQGAIEGSKHNGFLAGSIVALVDPIPFVNGVTNTQESFGGRDPEEDDAYRERIQLAPTRYSCAGPSDAYVYYALGAGTDILDASAIMTAPGCVQVTVLLPEDHPKPQQALDGVMAAVNDRTVRPLTDQVIVCRAADVGYSISVHYYVAAGREAQVVEAIEGVGGALEVYRAWQDSALGRSVNPDKLRALLFAAGAERIEVTAPGHMSLNATQRAKCSGIAVTHEVAV